MIDVREITKTAFHYNKGVAQNWNAEPDTLRAIAELANSNMRTVETGTGASTVVFAAAGSNHTAISPHAREHEQILKYCTSAGIDVGRLSFEVGRGEDVLPTLEGEVDLGFIDGAHSFPHPAIDFFYVARRLSVGGFLVFDDVPIPSVGMVHRHLDADPHWRLDQIVGNRATVFRKIEEAVPGDQWKAQAVNSSYPDFRWLPPRQRARRALDHRRGQARRLAGRVARR